MIRRREWELGVRKTYRFSELALLSIFMAMLSLRFIRSPLLPLTACSAGTPAVRCSAAIAAGGAESPSSLAMTASKGINWGAAKLQGPRAEMEDDLVLVTHDEAIPLLDGFSFAAVFDGHAGFSSVQFLREELYKECAAALQGGFLLSSKNFDSIRTALQSAFTKVDSKLLNWLDQQDKEDDSGSTATAMFVRNDLLVISHVGDSCVVISRRGRAETLTNPHRPYGRNPVSLEEVRRIRAAGGWIADGRICGDISVSRAFGDIRFKTRKNEMLEKGVKEGRWTQKYAARIQFKGDLVASLPDVYLVDLGSDVEFILLASDGLWDYMQSSDAVDFVRNQLLQHGDVQMACEALAQAALDRRSQDNVSILIAELGRTNWQDLPPQRPNFFYELTQAFATVAIVSVGLWISSLLVV